MIIACNYLVVQVHVLYDLISEYVWGDCLCLTDGWYLSRQISRLMWYLVPYSYSASLVNMQKKSSLGRGGVF